MKRDKDNGSSLAVTERAQRFEVPPFPLLLGTTSPMSRGQYIWSRREERKDLDQTAQNSYIIVGLDACLKFFCHNASAGTRLSRRLNTLYMCMHCSRHALLRGMPVSLLLLL